MSELMRIFQDVEVARQTVLRRRSWDEVEITAELQADIRRLTFSQLQSGHDTERSPPKTRHSNSLSHLAHIYS